VINRLTLGATTLLSAQAGAQVAVDTAAATGSAWSPYVAGGLIGVLAIATMYFSGHPIGASGAYAKAVGVMMKRVAPKHTESLPYYKKEPPALDWEFFLVVGAILGAFLAAASGGELTGRAVPPMWAARFGPEVWPRLLVGLLGGVAMAYGARVAGGCTSGHGISGALQLSVGSWIALVCFFLGGVPVAMLLYRL
jgi:uncharacterized membrane protein YedE/YeeE